MEKSIFNSSGEFDLSTTVPETYNNSCQINGYAVIINNFNFTGRLDNLPGGDKDSRRLMDTFRGLKFDVKVFENITKDQMMSTMKDFGNKDHSEYNMFACVLSSHGSNQSICGSNGKPVMLIDLMKDIINCKSLKGKPKLFFIDVCRTLSQNSHIVIPKKYADYMICYSTLEGNKAFMLDDSEQFEGSVFCKILCDVLRKYGDEMAFHEILQKLKSAMNYVKTEQKVEILESLTKILWFIPENHSINYTCTVGIDFGTSMSGFAYSTQKQYLHSPLSIFHKQCWNNESKNHDTMKTASCLLLDSTKNLVAFGFDAQVEFTRLQMENKHQEYYYFHNFKMSIYNHQTSLSNLQLDDIQNKTLPAKYVFSASIRAIKQEVMRTLESHNEIKYQENIRWVLTVPAIWPDDAKLFMRECAHEAELPWDQLLIALEPEAASIYCQFLGINRGINLSDGFQLTETGTKYMIVDVGGGTTDITIHQKEKNGQLRELNKASGINIGSSYINEKIIGMFEDIFGSTIMKRIKAENPSVYLDLCWEIESVKKTVVSKRSNEVKIAISYPVFNSLCLQEEKRTIDDVITRHNNSNNALKVQFKDDKIAVEKDYLLNHFRSLVELIKKEAKKAIQTIDVSLIVLVGGFADCRFLNEEMKLFFKPIRVISPEDADLAVLKGAVLYGHKPTVINPRITKFTYGIQVLGSFDEDKHDRSRREHDGWGNVCCRNAFDLIICENENVPLGKVITKNYCTSRPFQKYMFLNFFTCNVESPLYTDDGSCRKIGEVRIKIPNPSSIRRSVVVQYIFGDTEVKVKAIEQKFGDQVEIKLCL